MEQQLDWLRIDELNGFRPCSAINNKLHFFAFGCKEIESLFVVCCALLHFIPNFLFSQTQRKVFHFIPPTSPLRAKPAHVNWFIEFVHSFPFNHKSINQMTPPFRLVCLVVLFLLAEPLAGQPAHNPPKNQAKEREPFSNSIFSSFLSISSIHQRWNEWNGEKREGRRRRAPFHLFFLLSSSLRGAYGRCAGP